MTQQEAEEFLTEINRIAEESYPGITQMLKDCQSALDILRVIEEINAINRPSIKTFTGHLVHW